MNGIRFPTCYPMTDFGTLYLIGRIENRCYKYRRYSVAVRMLVIGAARTVSTFVE